MLGLERAYVGVRCLKKLGSTQQRPRDFRFPHENHNSLRVTPPTFFAVVFFLNEFYHQGGPLVVFTCESAHKTASVPHVGIIISLLIASFRKYLYKCYCYEYIDNV
jgi:hypothetical protein